MSVEIVTSDRLAVFRTLRDIQRKKRTMSLRDLRHRGKTNICVTAARESSDSFNDGSFTKFCDRRFIHSARLSLVKLYAYTKPTHNNPGRVDKSCQKCGNRNPLVQETLPHVLVYCMVHSNLMKNGHNEIVKRIKKAAEARWTIIGEDRVVGTENCRLDLVIQKGNYAIIIDITVPFDNGLKAFTQARTVKMTKHARLAQEFSLSGKNAVVKAVVVGALGSWDPANDRVMKRICSKKYMKVLKKKVVSEKFRTHKTFLKRMFATQSDIMKFHL